MKEVERKKKLLAKERKKTNKESEYKKQAMQERDSMKTK